MRAVLVGGGAVLLLVMSGENGKSSVWQDINQGAGVAIFSDDLLWDDPPIEAGVRMGLVKESETAIDSVYRSYSGGQSLSLGGRLKSMQVSERGGGLTSVTMVFSNQGDGGGGEDSVEAAIRADRREVGAALQRLLGRGDSYSFGRGARREPGWRWDWQGHSFILIYKPDKYVALRIVPTDSLQGYGKRILDKDLREEVERRVVRRTNGDVVIGGLPMVDQGDKGYCVPAVWEMALRAMGVEADMYLLGAEMASDGGAGTDLGRAISVGRGVAEDGGRTMTTQRLGGDTRDVSKWIDRGIPLIWAIRCSEEFVASGLDRTRERRGMTDPEKWKQAYSPPSEPRDIGRANWFGHVCLIVGYNHKTGEIAISDSWGPGHHERWHSQEEVGAVSTGEFFAFEF